VYNETERSALKIKEVKPERDLYYVIVNEAGASVYSASKVAQDEFADLEAAMRGNISIARRLQDPLAELVKIDPKSIGVGLYQHDVNQKLLGQTLHNVVESCVNNVGVDINTASVSLLKYVSGINDRSAKNIIQYREKKNVVISFVPAAWTPVCSDQWPGYNIARSLFEKYNTILLGITVDNIPTLHAWTNEMGELWFPVLSDFWPHGAVAEKYGVLRSDGVSERAIFIIDKKGLIRYIDIHDINTRPKLEVLVKELDKLEK